MRLLVTRPEAEARVLADRLTAAGHSVIVEPLLEIVPLETGLIILSDVQAVLLTSRNAVPALEQLARDASARRIPVLAVGEATARAARRAGFASVTAGPSTARELLGLVQETCAPDAGPLLHLSGEKVAFDLTPALAALGFHVERRAVYRSVPRRAFSPSTAEAIGKGLIDGVILMSPATAEAYATLIGVHHLAGAARRIMHLCLSAAVSARLDPLGTVPVAIAVQPNLEEVLALLATLAAQSSQRS
jgi:uroporphyrinogen-III synthase